MFLKHVKKELSAYCNGELPAKESRRAAEHLIGCNRCRTEFEEIRLRVKLAQQLPTIAAADSLWPELQALLSENGITHSGSGASLAFTTDPRTTQRLH